MAPHLQPTFAEMTFIQYITLTDKVYSYLELYNMFIRIPKIKSFQKQIPTFGKLFICSKK